MEETILTNYGGYRKEDYENLRYKFSNSETIENNYSQAFQDMFVLSMLDGKKNGIYIEVGGDHPLTINNTYILEKEFDWTGISFEIREDAVKFYNQYRKNKCLCANATNLNYSEIFEEYNLPNQIDYLQLDIEPAHQTLAALKQFDLEKYRFSVITFETDAYMGNSHVIDESRSILLDLGYKLVASNVCNQGNPFEDWYIDPMVVPEQRWSFFEKSFVEGREVILK